MPSTVKECGRSFLCTSLRMNLQLDSGYSRSRLVVRNCLVKLKALESRKRFQLQPPHVYRIRGRINWGRHPKDPNTKSVAAPNLGFQKHSYSLSSGILRYSQDRLLMRRNWGCGTGCLSQVQSVCKATFWLPSWHSASIPVLRVLSVNCLTRHVACADCSWAP